ncbi:hypothetical protein HMPREF9098_2047 [Kingella denitrificans ATCC 33394]|uniref:Uncharacterized protein n=1 Tax=Kingella denitrificans ATCC 33394 TaxID=888741 RepID=F0F1R2_9NEIS|nr:hypothetical protein HMPREF9098_2047 [Kingella denitrificans ATCC 33394]
MPIDASMKIPLSASGIFFVRIIKCRLLFRVPKSSLHVYSAVDSIVD